MVKKNNIQEQMEMISYLMSYDRSKILSEQPESVMDRRTGIENRNMTALSIPKTQQGYQEYSDATQPWRQIDSHILLPIVSFALYMSAPLTGPVGPLLAIGIEGIDAATYAAEGDNFSAGLTLAFALIPGGDLINKIPGVKTYGKKFVINALKKANLGKILTKAEYEVVEQVSKNSTSLTQMGSKELVKKVVNQTFTNLPLKSKISKLRELQLKYPKTFGLINTGIQIGGVMYSWCEIAKKYGITGAGANGWCNTNTSVSGTTATTEQPIIVTDNDTVWDYKKDGNKYYTKKKGTNTWILTTGDVETAIRTKVFNISDDAELSSVRASLNMTEEQINKELDKKVMEGINKLPIADRDSILTDFVTSIL